MSALESNEQITNFLKRGLQPISKDDTDQHPEKGSRLCDSAITLIAAELGTATKE